MKTSEEVNALKEEVEILSRKLAELNEDELKQVTGGSDGFGRIEKLDYGIVYKKDGMKLPAWSRRRSLLFRRYQYSTAEVKNHPRF